MGQETEIAWTGTPRPDGTIEPGATFNPWWGCFKISEGCKNCYADTFARRVGLKVWGPNAEHRRFGEKHWNEPRKWNRDAAKAGIRRRVFCASMADVFEGREEDDEDRARLFALIAETPHLDWLLLTKRPENIVPLLRRAVSAVYAEHAKGAVFAERWLNAEPPRNVWIGCTVENQEAADRRVPELLRVPAAVRFLSVEPMLDFINLSAALFTQPPVFTGEIDEEPTAGGLWSGPRSLSADGVHWVIVGGESGPGARPFDLAWAASLSEQCRAAGVPYFFKQAGADPLPPGWMADHKNRPGSVSLKDRKGGDVAELARLFPDLAAAGAFRREWPTITTTAGDSAA